VAASWVYWPPTGRSIWPLTSVGGIAKFSGLKAAACHAEHNRTDMAGTSWLVNAQFECLPSGPHRDLALSIRAAHRPINRRTER
jgi:hypothetical protein